MAKFNPDIFKCYLPLLVDTTQYEIFATAHKDPLSDNMLMTYVIYKDGQELAGRTVHTLPNAAYEAIARDALEVACFNPLALKRQ
jgi:hypothetical protein